MYHRGVYTITESQHRAVIGEEDGVERRLRLYRLLQALGPSIPGSSFALGRSCEAAVTFPFPEPPVVEG